jgi:sporulation protein YlmC with PRC-barrel domain
MKFRSLTCASVLAALAGAVAAQEPPAAPSTATVEIKKIKLQRVGGDLLGKSVVTPKDEALGKVEDVLIHPKGEIAFLECSGAGALDTGAARYPVPWNACERNEAGQIVLAVDPGKFREMPRYDRPKLTAMDFWQNADKAYRHITAEKASPAEASTSLAPAKKLYLGSDLRARTIENPEGEKIATVNEIVVDPNLGRIAYVVLAVGGSTAGGGERSIAVPWEALKVMPDKQNPEFDRFTLATSKEQLAKAPEFQATSDGWEKASQPDYVVQVYEFYALPPYGLTQKPAGAKEPEGDK